MRAVQIRQFGGPEVLEVVDIPEPENEPGTVRIAVTRAGVNYADTHQAENSYLAPQELPLIPGAEVAGTTEDGRRVVALMNGGGYAEVARPLGPFTFDVPDAISDDAAVALLLQGLTAWHLLRTSAGGVKGRSVVVHAAAGGVGTLAVQLAKLEGASRVIALASNESKRDLATELGADVTIDSRTDNMKEELEAANEGRKVDVVLEMVGGKTFDASLAALAPFGHLVTFGTASRKAPKPIMAGALVQRSRAVVGFWLAHCFRDPARLLGEPLTELFDHTVAGRLRPIVGSTYRLSEAPQAHRDIRERGTVGKLLLDPTT